MVRVDHECLSHCLASEPQAFLARAQGISDLVEVITGQFIPRRRVARVDRQRLLVQRDGMFVSFGGAKARDVACLQEQRIGLRLDFLGLRHVPQQRDLELIDHRRGDLVLHREDVVKLAVPGVRPQGPVRARLDQLRGDANFVAGRPHRAFEDMRHVQLLGNLRELHVLALERERRRTAR